MSVLITHKINLKLSCYATVFAVVQNKSKVREMERKMSGPIISTVTTGLTAPYPTSTGTSPTPSDQKEMKPVIQHTGIVLQEEKSHFVLCKPKLLPLKSLTIEKMEKLQRDASAKAKKQMDEQLHKQDNQEMQ